MLKSIAVDYASVAGLARHSITWLGPRAFIFALVFNSRSILWGRAKNSVTKETELNFRHFFKKIYALATVQLLCYGNSWLVF